MCRRAVTIFLLLWACACAFGCDHKDTAPPDTVPDPSTLRPAVDVTLITPLLPRLRTHLALDSKGNLYWLQESDPPAPGGDLVFVMGEGGVPQAIPQVSVANLLAAGGWTGGAGSVQSIAVGPDDKLYLAFVGSQRAKPICFVAQYDRPNQKLRVVADTAKLVAVSRMGTSIGLAHATLVPAPGHLWLWLRHTDAAALLRLTMPGDRSDTAIRPLAIKPPSGTKRFLLNSESDDLSAGDGQNLYYLDGPRQTLWRINGDLELGGSVVRVLSLSNLPQSLTPPVESLGRLYVVAGDAPPFAPPDEDAAPVANPFKVSEVHYPALLDFAADAVDAKPQTVDRTRWDAPTALALQSLQPRGLVWDRARGTLLTFDAASGEILRLRLTKR